MIGRALPAALLALACSTTEDARTECTPGDTRDCPCGPECGSYEGCGECITIAIAWYATETCEPDGTWGICDCNLPIEPECEGLEPHSCAARCSAILRDVLHGLPGGGSEPDCRHAFSAMESCLGLCSDRTSFEGCEAEISAMDDACMESPPACYWD